MAMHDKIVKPYYPPVRNPIVDAANGILCCTGDGIGEPPYLPPPEGYFWMGTDNGWSLQKKKENTYDR